jgi:hypothetical protein
LLIPLVAATVTATILAYIAAFGFVGLYNLLLGFAHLLLHAVLKHG